MVVQWSEDKESVGSESDEAEGRGVGVDLKSGSERSTLS